ncbi:uncharacterized protein LOC132733835 [Ruditapes philippinarum]|uniref:uncharacterized protein LOC132733835 n=1 Tax=Ruditapes philippinarum TaxID=129788 RepID=UPI00295A64E6|nr:uncharacterized protein LOC132733835 [Ruditapes philippinarum]
MDKLIILSLFHGLFTILSVEGCILPLSAGTWVSSTRGTWTVSDDGTFSTISNFKADLSRSLTTVTLDCKSSSGTQYILGTRFEIFFAVFIDVYTCLDIRTTAVSPNSYVYYIVTPTESNTGERFTSDISSACTNSNFETAINTHIVLQSGSETAAGVNYPDAILGNYTVEYSDIDGNTVTGSDMDSCDNKTLMVFNNADSNTNLAFTSGNNLLALHYVTSGSSVYVHTYNTDATVSNPTTYSIACWVIVSSSSQVKATVYPNECVQGQSSTSVPYGGQKFVLTPQCEYMY